jgi:hypothetical protein
MDKVSRSGEIDEALSEVAKQRDRRLSKAPTLAPAREAFLADFLAREFPLETALRERAMERDALLDSRAPQIPSSMELNLRRQLGAAQATRAGRVCLPAWLRLFRSPLGGALTVCAIIGALLFFGRWGTSTPRHAENLAHVPRADGMIWEAELLDRSAAINPFNLNTNEPASLQASFFSKSGAYLANASDATLGLRLDLPVRAILTDDNRARTP